MYGMVDAAEIKKLAERLYIVEGDIVGTMDIGEQVEREKEYDEIIARLRELLAI